MHKFLQPNVKLLKPLSLAGLCLSLFGHNSANSGLLVNDELFLEYAQKPTNKIDIHVKLPSSANEGFTHQVPTIIKDPLGKPHKLSFIYRKTQNPSEWNVTLSGQDAQNTVFLVYDTDSQEEILQSSYFTLYYNEDGYVEKYNGNVKIKAEWPNGNANQSVIDTNFYFCSEEYTSFVNLFHFFPECPEYKDMAITLRKESM